MYIDLDAVVIRPMTEGDLPTVMTINQACFIRPFPEKFCRSFLDVPEKFGTVAEYSGSVVGMMLYERRPASVYLGVMAIEPYFQERKIGKRLVRWLQSQLPQLERTALELHVYSLDLAPLRLYGSTDFKLVEEIPNAYGDGVPGYLMRYVAN